MQSKPSKKINPDRTLDCIGLYCPEPVFRTRVELDRMGVDEVLEVVADDPAAEEDIKSLVKRIGYDLLKISREDDFLRFLIRKTK
jgi:TusA-related sulfurtransferase